jgi:putative spermidine/putrescine transport system permease protein
MRLSRTGKIGLRAAVALVLAFIYIPLLVIAVEAFNSSRILKWPPPGFTLSWFGKAIESESAREALLTSIEAGAVAMAIAVVLGTLIALAVGRRRFFGRDTISFLVVLPIALPGIVTGVAFSNTFTQVLGISLSLMTVIIGHATFCIVVVYNNVVARLRRTSGSFEEASADLGADPWQTFRFVTFPSLRSALGAGALLAFALSFDEIVVTNFTIGAGEETLPIWIYHNLFRPKELPVVPAVAVILILLSIIPVYLAHRLSSDEGGLTIGRGGGGQGGAEAPGGAPGRVEAETLTAA